MIYMPDDQQVRTLIEDGWKDLRQRVINEAGIDIEKCQHRDGFKDFFVAGYCAGYNDVLGIVRDQFTISEETDKIFSINN